MILKDHSKLLIKNFIQIKVNAVPTLNELNKWKKWNYIINKGKGDLLLFNQQIYHKHTLEVKKKWMLYGSK